MLNDLRQQFWILKGRKTVQGMTTKCIHCWRCVEKRIETIHMPLPEDRDWDALVSDVTGVDLAGPLYLREEKKLCNLLFTCAVYCVVHMKSVTSLSTNGFMLGLKKFVARHGWLKVTCSDNGTNFVSREDPLKSLNCTKTTQEASIFRIQWKYNPPTAAWWGICWKQAIQMIKKLLGRVLGTASLKYEEMMTFLCNTEAVINWRTLNYLSEGPKNLSLLTPMFIQNIPSMDVPDLDHAYKWFKYQQKLRKTMEKIQKWVPGSSGSAAGEEERDRGSQGRRCSTDWVQQQEEAGLAVRVSCFAFPSEW